MADFKCFPIWEVFDNNGVDEVDPKGLPITEDLKLALHNWMLCYDQTLNEDYPPDSGFASPAEEAEFGAEGKRLWKELKEQLGPEYRVTYFSRLEGRMLE